jgi:hypothetical protein
MCGDDDHRRKLAAEGRASTGSKCAKGVRVRSVLPMIMCFIPSFMLLGIVPAIVSAVFNAFA